MSIPVFIFVKPLQGNINFFGRSFLFFLYKSVEQKNRVLFKSNIQYPNIILTNNSYFPKRPAGKFFDMRQNRRKTVKLDILKNPKNFSLLLFL